MPFLFLAALVAALLIAGAAAASAEPGGLSGPVGLDA
jgi:hypothetical protein